MPVTVEDGTLIVGANSYVSEAYATAFADARGLTLTSDATLLAQLLIRATDFLDSYGLKFSGTRVSSDQALQWPRKGAYLECEFIPSDSIPIPLMNATVQMAIALEAGFDPTGGTSGSAGGEIIKEEIGPIKVTYSEGVSASTSTLAVVNALIKPLLRSGGSSINFLRV